MTSWPFTWLVKKMLWSTTKLSHHKFHHTLRCHFDPPTKCSKMYLIRLKIYQSNLLDHTRVEKLIPSSWKDFAVDQNNFLSILVSRLSYDFLVRFIKMDQNISCVNLYSSKSTMLDPSMAKYIADRPNYSGRTALNKVLTQLENPKHNLLKWHSK